MGVSTVQMIVERDSLCCVVAGVVARESVGLILEK